MPTPRAEQWSAGLVTRAQIACGDCPKIPLQTQFRSLTAQYVQWGFADGGSIWLKKVLTFSSGGTRTVDVSPTDGAETTTDDGDLSGVVTSTVYSMENTEAATRARAVALADAAEVTSDWTSLPWGDDLLAAYSGRTPFSGAASSFARETKSGTTIVVTRIEQRIRLQPTPPALCDGRRYFVAVRLVTHSADTISEDADYEIDVPADGSWSEVQEVGEPDTGTLEDVRAELLQETAGEGTIAVWERECVVPRLAGFPALTGPGAIYRQALLAGPLSGTATFSAFEVLGLAGLTFAFASSIPSPLYDEEGEKLFPFPDISLTQPDGTSRLVVRGPLPADTEEALGQANMRGWRLGTPAPDELSESMVRYADYSITLSDPWLPDELSALVDDYFAGGEGDYLVGPLGDLRTPPGTVATGRPLARRRGAAASWVERRAYVEWRPAAAHLAGRGGTGTGLPSLTVAFRQVAWDGAEIGTDGGTLAPDDTLTVPLGDDQLVWLQSAVSDAPDEHKLRPAGGGFGGWILQSVEE